VSAGGPVLVTGLADTGKTPLARVLTDRTSFVIVRHTRLLRSTRPEQLSRPATHAWLGTLLAGPAASRLHPDPGRLGALVAAGATVAEVLDDLHTGYARQLGGRRWGEQCGAGVVDVDPVLRALPTARVIHLVRHPASSYAVTAARRGARPGGLGRHTAQWVASVDRARAAAERFPDRVLVVRRESLVECTDAAVRSICRFLHEPTDPPAYDLGVTDTAVPDRDSEVVAFVERHAAAQLGWVGYPPTARPHRWSSVTGPSLDRVALAVARRSSRADGPRRQEVAR
jgi:hypothetical protein